MLKCSAPSRDFLYKYRRECCVHVCTASTRLRASFVGSCTQASGQARDWAGAGIVRRRRARGRRGHEYIWAGAEIAASELGVVHESTIQQDHYDSRKNWWTEGIFDVDYDNEVRFTLHMKL